MLHILDKQTDMIVSVLDNQLEDKVYWNDLHTDAMNELETFDFEAKSNAKGAEHLTGQNRVLIPGETPGVYREFIIFDTFKNTGGNIEVKTNGSYIEIKKDSILKPFNQGPVNPTAAIEYGLNETEWKPGRVEYAPVQEVSSESAIDRWEYLLMVAEKFNMILNFRVEVFGPSITGRYVDLLHTVGSNNGKEIELGKDLVNVTRHENTDDVITALLVEGPPAENGARISVVVSSDEARQRWGRNGRHRWGYFEVEQVGNEPLTEATVTARGQEHLDKMLNSVVQYEVEGIALESVFGMTHERAIKGDEVRVKDTSFYPPLYLEAKLIKVERSPSNPKSKKYYLGDFVEYTEAEVMATFRKLRNELAKKLGRDEIVDLIDQEGIPRQPNPPTNPKFNALWLDTSVVPNVLKRWDGQKWVKASPTVPEDIGAVPPAYVDMKQEIMRLRIEIGTVSNTQTEKGTEVAALNNNPWLANEIDVKNALNAAANDFNTKANDLISQITTAVNDATLEQIEEVAINSKRALYRTALNTLITRIRAAEDAIVKASMNEVVNFGERKIFKGPTQPKAAESQNLDLWVDSSVSPPVWKQYVNNTWTGITRTNLSDLKGTIGANQVAANIITSNMISTAGLDAGVITTGILSGITVEVTRAGLTNEGNLSTSTRFWAGSTFALRDSAPFRVTQAGKMIASNVEIDGGTFVSSSGSTSSSDGQKVSIVTDGELRLEHRKFVGGSVLTRRSSLDEERLLFNGGVTYGKGGIVRSPNVLGTVDFELPEKTRVNGLFTVIGDMDFKTGTGLTDDYLQVFRDSSGNANLKARGRIKLNPSLGQFDFFTSSGGDSMMQGFVSGKVSSILKWTSQGLQVRTSSDGALASISASAFSTTSLEELKDDIKPLVSALDKIRKSPVYDYVRKETEPGKTKAREVGLLHHEAPKDIVDSNSTINLYSMQGFQWRGLQELAEIVEELVIAVKPLVANKGYSKKLERFAQNRT